MGMSEFYGAAATQESIATIHHALERGVNFSTRPTCTASGKNEELVGKAIRDRRDSVFLATKFGNVRGPDGEFLGAGRSRICPLGVRSEPEAARRRRHRSLLPAPRRPQRADRGYGRRDGSAQGGGEGPFSRLVRGRAARPSAGRTRHPIAALQTELSLWSRDAEAEVLPTVRELGIGYVAYSPLGRGFLTGHSSRPTISRRTISASTIRASRAKISPRTSRWSARSRRWRKKGLHHRAARARLGAGPGRGHRADPRDQAGPLSRRKYRRAGRQAR